MNFYSNKTILVTGATGLIGSNIIDKLMTFDNVNVIALSRNEKKLKEAFSCYQDFPNFSYIVQDVSEPLMCDKSIDIIFHAASPMERKIVAEKPLSVIFPNLYGTKNCLDFIVKQQKNIDKKCRLILFSSVTVYGNITDSDRKVKEEDTNITDFIENLKAPYSQSKRMSEVIALAYGKQHNTDTVIARFSTVYGDTRFIPDTAFFEFVKKGIKGEDITIQSADAPRRDNIYIDDAINGVLTIGALGKTSEAYNISSNTELNNYAAIDEIAQIAINESNKKFHRISQDCSKVIKPTNSPNRQAGIILDNQKLKNLGWKVQTTLQEGIRLTIDKIYSKGI